MERSVLSSEEDVHEHLGAPTTSTGTKSIRLQAPYPLDPPATRQSRQYPEHLQKAYGLGFTPPVRRGSPLNPQKNTQRRSLQNAGSVLDSPPARHRRIPSPGVVDMESLGVKRDAETGVFSNEYDLAHEDPRILLDVQRALKLKARREARLKKEQSASSQCSSSVAPPSTTQSPADSLWRPRMTSLSSAPSMPGYDPPRKVSEGTTSDLDFSPATGVQNIASYPHPVPTSLDNGKTLDWTGSYSDDDKLEKRWPILGKKKDKDKILPLQTLAEQQETIYRDKLQKLKMVCTSQTQRKASITREQLGRRYKLLSDANLANGAPFNYLAVAKWYSKAGRAAKQSMERAEPFTWLKHLEKSSPRQERSDWHLSALVMEEYVQAQTSMPTVSENSVMESSVSQDTSSASLDPSTGLGSPDIISFEPRRDSAELAEIRKVRSFETGSSLPTSGPPTTQSPFKNNTSPRSYHQAYLGGDGTLSQEASSDISESDINDDSPFVRPPARKPENPSPPIQVVVTQDVDQRSEQVATEPLQIAISTSGSTKASNDASLSSDKSANAFVSRTSSQRRLPRRIRVSRPSVDAPRRPPEEYEFSNEREYERKARLVEEVNTHNHRVRQTLNRLAAAVREYDALQNTASKTPDITHLPLPKELVEAFSHDPAAVTGATRRLSGWRAVEDIHQRVLRQREIFQSFLHQERGPPVDSMPILGSPIAKLIGALDVLEAEKNDIVTTTTSLTDLLQKVQTIHRGVKTDYNNTVSVTSVVYPELSHITALEESYRDQYQQLWDFGMDALTLLLDTVTPFWRNYGKTIGEDVRDFLIIPLYRNEFTGEPKRYLLREVPRRSLRHWLGFCLFFLCSIGVTLLQLRAAVTSSISYRLQWIPYDGARWTALPFFWIGILIQWIAVLFEFSIVLMQLGTMAWWIGWLVNVFQ